ncbi:hypothetical protein FG386_002335 [Cryptosporidium ryanae]|uniref:uncharacterized protein n=1 Tax=Cryptosporidium ryanae TaxID=515981 RepID=UPI00351A7069|nr:hypothetical protein FG386_002335 [Cryptosporidium ryanae]
MNNECSSENNIYSIYRPPEYMKVLQKFYRNKANNRIKIFSVFERVLNNTCERIDSLFLNINNIIERISESKSCTNNCKYERNDDFITEKSLLSRIQIKDSDNNDSSNIYSCKYAQNNELAIYFLKNIKYSLYSNMGEINKYGLTSDETIKFKKSIVSLLSNIKDRF